MLDKVIEVDESAKGAKKGIRHTAMDKKAVNIQIVNGDLLTQPVDAIVNLWNRNIIPWWLLLPQGVSAAIKKRGGTEPFRELGKLGAIPLGHAVLTTAGRLPFRGIIHVAGINLLWRSSETSIRDSVTHALQTGVDAGMKSMAMPLIGAGTGGFGADRTREIILDQLTSLSPGIPVSVVTFKKGPRP